MDGDHVRETTAQLEANSKRRKVRKGTRSCWDCKRRKVKCSFESLPTTTDAELCTGCKKRGSKCISQEFDIPDELPAPAKRPKGQARAKGESDHERVVRVEAMLEQLVKKAGNDGTTVATSASATSEDGWNTTGIPTPVSVDLGCSTYSDPQNCSEGNHANVTSGIESQCQKLSRELYDALPSRQDIEIICKAHSSKSILLCEKLTTPYPVMEQHGLKTAEMFLDMPGRKTHPVLMARYMLQLAAFLQRFKYSSPEVFQYGPPEDVKHLSEPVHVIMKRMAETAISMITGNDEYLGSLEGLECIMIESLYQHTAGNLRRSWVAMRKAMLIAQLMGLHRPGHRVQYKLLDPKTKSNPQFMWFRIVFFDRHFCLMLGLPQGSLDRTMASDRMFVEDTPMGRLERMHCEIASRILELNESDPSAHHFARTKELDEGLQKAARSLPPKWWLSPNLACDDSVAFYDAMGRLFNQLFHYNLLNQLHIPFMLRSSTEHKYDYSKITCVNASQEVLTRFIMFCVFNQDEPGCRPLNFFALMAAMTLLLAHLDSHRYPQTGNLLAHQYLHDRAMIEQTQEHMEAMSRRDGDVLTSKSAALLHRFLAILGEAADGNMRNVENMSVNVKAPEAEMEQADEVINSTLRFFVPYCGIIMIAREGVISKEKPTTKYPLPSNLQNENTNLTESYNRESMTSMEPVQEDGKELSSMLRPRSAALESTRGQLQHFSDPPAGVNITATQPLPQFQSEFFDPLLQQYEYPVPTAGMDDWAFQGVDTAFFTNLMRGMEEDVNDGAEWASWTPP